MSREFIKKTRDWLLGMLEELHWYSAVNSPLPKFVECFLWYRYCGTIRAFGGKLPWD